MSRFYKTDKAVHQRIVKNGRKSSWENTGQFFRGHFKPQSETKQDGALNNQEAKFKFTTPYNTEILKGDRLVIDCLTYKVSDIKRVKSGISIDELRVDLAIDEGEGRGRSSE